MSEKSKSDATKTEVSRKLTGRLKEGDRIVAVKKCEEAPTHVPVPDPNYDFSETSCRGKADLDLRLVDSSSSDGDLFFLKGDSSAIIEDDGTTRLILPATEPTLRTYGVTLERLLEFVSVLRNEFGYKVQIFSGENYE